MNNKIEILLDSQELADAIQKVLSRTNSIGVNPLSALMVESINEAAPRIKAKLTQILNDFISSESFEKKLREVYKDAFIGEAARMGRNAAKAIINEK
jgi:hypothetical protein